MKLITAKDKQAIQKARDAFLCEDAVINLEDAKESMQTFICLVEKSVDPALLKDCYEYKEARDALAQAKSRDDTLVLENAFSDLDTWLYKRKILKTRAGEEILSGRIKQRKA